MLRHICTKVSDVSLARQSCHMAQTHMSGSSAARPPVAGTVTHHTEAAPTAAVSTAAVVVEEADKLSHSEANAYQPTMQPGDVKETAADISAIQRDVGFAPTTPISVGIPRFIEWFKQYHGL